MINDTLILQQGFLRSKVSTDEHAFGTGPYTLKGREITAQIKSNYEGKIDWSCLWTGDTIAGRMVWTRRDGTVLTYTFSGTRAPVEKDVYRCLFRPAPSGKHTRRSAAPTAALPANVPDAAARGRRRPDPASPDGHLRGSDSPSGRRESRWSG